jgi:hypothetical protein
MQVGQFALGLEDLELSLAVQVQGKASTVVPTVFKLGKGVH